MTKVASSNLDGFRGDLHWVHQREGHAGKPYWPETRDKVSGELKSKGISGVTLDPGVDLGYADPSTVRELYAPILTPEQMAAVEKVFGLKGEKAEEALKSDPLLKSIRISKQQAETVMPYAAKKYWEPITKRFPELKDPETPASVQTAFLSLAYNRGPGNKAFNGFKQLFHQKNWEEVARQIGEMQQDHKSPGIPKRRQQEAELIKKELKAANGSSSQIQRQPYKPKSKPTSKSLEQRHLEEAAMKFTDKTGKTVFQKTSVKYRDSKTGKIVEESWTPSEDASVIRI